MSRLLAFLRSLAPSFAPIEEPVVPVRFELWADLDGLPVVRDLELGRDYRFLFWDDACDAWTQFTEANRATSIHYPYTITPKGYSA